MSLSLGKEDKCSVVRSSRQASSKLLLQIKVLDGTPYEWLAKLLECFNNGDMHSYDRLCAEYAEILNSLPAMVDNERKLREKITILALTELIFKCVNA